MFIMNSGVVSLYGDSRSSRALVPSLLKLLNRYRTFLLSGHGKTGRVKLLVGF